MKRTLLFCFAFVFAINVMVAQKTNRQYGFHTFLGVDVDNSSIKTDGLFINGVYKGFGAEKAGLQRGDILKAINSVQVHNFNELVKTLDEYKPGDEIEVSISRNNSSQTIAATVSDYPEFLKYNSPLWLKDVKNKTVIERATLGIDVEPVWEKYAVLVKDFEDNSAAAHAGVKQGDIILKIDDQEFATPEELRYTLSEYKPGDKVNLYIEREGKNLSLEVNLGKETISLEKEKSHKT